MSLLKISITTLLVFCLQLGAKSQMIYIFTADDEPITKIYVLDSQINQTLVSSSSTINLNKRLKPNSKAYIYAQGYDTLSFVVPDIKGSLTLTLKPVSELLKTVIISSSKQKKSYRDISSSVVQVKPYLIEERNNTELTEVINQIPAVNIVDNQASIRGGSGWSYGSGSRVMVTVDGLPMLSGDANQVQWQFLDMQNIASIEVLKGPSSVLYGSSALNGVINIETNKATDSVTGMVNTYTGIYEQPNNSGLQWTNQQLFKSGVNAFVAFKKRRLDVVLSTVNVRDNGYRMGEEANRSRIAGNFIYNFNKRWKAGVKLAGMRNSGGTFLLWESDSLGYTALDSQFNKNISTRLSVDPFVAYKGEIFKHQILGRYFNLKNDIFQQDTLSNQSNSSQFAYAEYRASSDKLLPLNLTFGAVYNQAQTNSPLFQGVQIAENYSAYLQMEKRVKKWFFNAGIRYESFVLNKRQEGRPIFKGGATYTPHKYTILRASYGEGFRFPSIAESYIQTSVGPVSVYPNENIEAEEAWNLEIGIKQGLRIGKANLFIDVAGYYNKIDNMVEFMFAQWSSNMSSTNSFGFGFKSVNVGSAVIQGVDANVIGNLQIGKNKLKVLAGYLLSDARHTDFDEFIGIDTGSREFSYKSTSSDTNTGVLKYRSLHTIKADIQWDRGPWSAGVSVRYNSFIENIDRAFLEFPIGFAVPGIENQRIINKNGNTVVDLRLSKKFKRDFKIAFIVNNLFNSLFMERPADLQPPRYFMVQIAKKI